MTYRDINNRFTEIVAEYIAKGYTFNTSSMGGSQGEIANIDLTNGKEIIRIVLSSFSNWRENLEGVEIAIGRCTDNVRPHSGQLHETVWNSHLEIVRTEYFYKISRYDNFYGTREEAEAAREVRHARYARREFSRTEYKPSEKAKAIAERIVRNKFGYLRVNPAEVKITKSSDGYCVVYRGKVYYLH